MPLMSLLLAARAATFPSVAARSVALRSCQVRNCLSACSVAYLENVSITIALERAMAACSAGLPA